MGFVLVSIGKLIYPNVATMSFGVGSEKFLMLHSKILNWIDLLMVGFT
jgi:hypothetical protein